MIKKLILKGIITILLLIYFFMFFQRSKSNDNSGNLKVNYTSSKKFVQTMLNRNIYANNIELIPLTEYDIGFRYYQYESWGEYSIILTLKESPGGLSVQLIEQIKEPNIFLVKEIKLSESDVSILKKSLKELQDISFNLDSNRLCADCSRFEFIYKNKDNIVASIGNPDLNSLTKGPHRSQYINKEKENLLSLISWLATICDIEKGEKHIVLANYSKKDSNSLPYYVFVANNFMMKKIDVLFDNKVLKSINDDGLYKINKNDTVNLYDRIKVRVTRWDGEVVEY